MPGCFLPSNSNSGPLGIDKVDVPTLAAKKQGHFLKEKEKEKLFNINQPPTCILREGGFLSDGQTDSRGRIGGLPLVAQRAVGHLFQCRKQFGFIGEEFLEVIPVMTR